MSATAAASAAQPLPWRAPVTWLRLAALATSFFVLALVGLRFAISDQVASPVWPPTGLAIAAVALWGRRAAAGVFAGALAAEWWYTDNLGLGLALAAGSTLEALIGGLLLERAGGAAALRTPPGMGRFAGAVLLAPIISALVGPASLIGFGVVPAEAWLGTTWTWYLGDAAGALVVAPVVLLAARPLARPRPAMVIETAGALLLVAAVCAFVFGLVPGTTLPIGFGVLIVPPLLWLAYRREPLAPALAVLVLDAVAVMAAARGTGPLIGPSDNASFLLVQLMVFTMGLVVLGLSALASDRRRALVELQARVAERTQSLEAEVLERRLAQAQAEEAERVAHLGTWRWDITKPHAEWSAELYRIYGLDPSTHRPTYDDYLTRVHPDDVERVKAATEAVFRDHSPYSHDERIRHTDGTWRHLHTWAHAVTDKDGKLVALAGSCQDITERVAQEEKFRGLLESAPDAIVIANEQGRIVLVNGQAETLFGYERAEILGQPVEMLLPQANRQRHVVHRTKYAAAEHPARRPMGAGLDLRARRKDGSEFPVEVSLSPLETPEGRLVSSAIRDVSQRREDARLVAESLQRFRALADVSPFGIVHTNPRGSVDYANAAWSKITGIEDYRDDALVTRSIHPDDQPAARQLWDECMVKGHEFVAEMRWVHPDGTVRLTSCRAVPMRDGSGQVTGFVSAVVDITDARAAEEARMKAHETQLEMRRLQEQADFKTNFLRTAAHELGTPLTPIRIQLHVLRRLLQGEDQEKAFGILERNLDRLNVLVKDLLESARLQSGRLKLNPRPMDLAHTLHEVAETFQEPAIQTGIALDTHGSPHLPMVADPDRISQVLYNLLSNAMKFTRPGGHVTVEAHGGSKEARITVRDDGQGFTSEQAARLFQPFSQVHDAMQSTQGGSGLGLYICRGIVEQHGGIITAHSDGPGKGATFTVVLPLPGLPPEGTPTRRDEPPKATPAQVQRGKR